MRRTTLWMRFPLGAQNFATFPQRCGSRCADLEKSSRELVDPDDLVSLRVPAEELVQLRSDEEDDRRDVEVRGHDEEEQEVPRGGLVVREVLQVPGVEGRLDEPRDDDHGRTDARPTSTAVLDRSEARDDPDGEPEEDG